jgi:hypothetical protein
MAKNVGPAALPRGIAIPAPAEPAAIERQILDFLDGRSDGAMLFDALYGLSGSTAADAAARPG